MKKQDIRTKTQDLVRDEMRSGKVARYADILGILPDVVAAIDVDKEVIANSIKQAIWDSSDSNPLNAILKILGLRLVSNRGLERDSQEQANTLDEALQMDKEKLSNAIRQMTNKLAEYETVSNQLDADNKKLICELNSQLNSETEKSRRASASYQGLRENIALRLQYMLLLIGQSPSENPVYQQVFELMEDMQLTAFWSAEDNEYSEVEMFSVMKTDDISNHKTKPCLMHRGEVVVKGVLFKEE